MEDVHTHQEIEVMMGETSNVDMNIIQDGKLSGELLGLAEETANCDKSDKSSTMQATQDQNITSYPPSVLVHSSLPESVICPVEPMDQSSVTLPTLAMAPGSDDPQKFLEGDDINQAWFTTKEDKDSLQGKGFPAGVKWRQGMWAKDEIDLLRNNILDYCKTHGIPDPRDVIFKQSKDERKSFYRTIAKGIHRPLFAIYRRVLRTYESGNYIGKYSPEEVHMLIELRKKHGNDWTAIGLALGRSSSSVKDRCRLLKEKCTSGKWTDREEQCLSCAVHQLTCTKSGESVTTGILWTNVAKMVGTRSEKQCRSKWLNYLNWKECGGKEWNKTDEIDLIKKVYDLGIENENEIDWAVLANGWVSVRSPQWLRSKWWTIKKHVPSLQNMSFSDTIAYLYSNYARNLRHRLDRHDPRYLQIPTLEQQYPLPGLLNTTGALTTCATVTTNVGQAISVDGEIFMTREDDKGADGLNAFEMVQLRALPNTDPSQPISYIIEPIHCSIAGSAPSYILHQASPHPGTKLVKVTGNCSVSRQVIDSNDVDNMQHENIPESSILSAPVSSLAQVSHDDVSSLVTTGTLHEEAVNLVGQNSSTGEINESYVENKHVDILEEQHPHLECITEREISTMTDQGRKNTEEFGNDVMSSDTDEKHKQCHNSPVSNQCTSLTSVSSRSLDINFSTSDNTLYSHSLPDNILQSQGDEPGFLPDSVISVQSPLSIVAGSLGEVTVSNSSNEVPSNGLIMDGEYHIDVSG